MSHGASHNNEPHFTGQPPLPGVESGMGRSLRAGMLTAAGCSAAIAAGAMIGCDDMPRDPNGTLGRVQGGTLIVGTTDRATLGDAENALIEALLADLDAEPRWFEAPLGDVMRALEDGDVDLAIGGLAQSDPWSSRVAFSKPYREEPGADGSTLKRVAAVQRGENAFVLRVDRVIARLGRPPHAP
jgi:DNA-binding transcriptional LysR family regulator